MDVKQYYDHHTNAYDTMLKYKEDEKSKKTFDKLLATF